MLIKDIIDENYQDYKLPSMVIATSVCDWKCCIEAQIPVSVCHNSKIAVQPSIEVSADEIFRRYTSNPLTKAVIFGGLEPLKQIDDVLSVIEHFRDNCCNDDIVIYTGYYPDEIKEQVKQLKHFSNIIIKYGRFIPNTDKRFDEILGIYLTSNNQFAERIS